jgi:uncharacterized protein YjbJ (UPF0337 family)
MNWDVIAGDLKQLKGDLRHLEGKGEQPLGKPTEDNLNPIDGKGDESAGKIQEAYGVTKEEVAQQAKIYKPTNNDYRMQNCRMKDSA